MAPIPDFNEAIGEIESRAFEYLRRTKSTDEARQELLWDNSELKWTIEKLDGGEPPLIRPSYSITPAKSQGIVISQLKQMLPPLLKGKATKDATVKPPTISTAAFRTYLLFFSRPNLIPQRNQANPPAAPAPAVMR